MKPAKAPTIHDVARAAGVSHMTVSRVINGKNTVRPETRRLVENAIAALDFAPSAAARALSRNEPLGLALLHRYPNPGSLGEFLVGLFDQTSRMHASLTVREVLDAEDPAAIAAELAQRGVHGVILAPPLGDDRALVGLLKAERLAMVATGATRLDARVASVGIDNLHAAQMMAEHLLTLGHRRIGFIKGHPAHASTDLRLAGFRRALEVAGVELGHEQVVEGRFTYQSGLEAAERLLSLSTPVTAIFASNDDMAAAAVAVAHRRGLNVPADLSVCGFDDSAMATTIWPTLTTVRRPTREIIAAALQLLRDELASGGDASTDKPHLLLEHQLIHRESDGPYPGTPNTLVQR